MSDTLRERGHDVFFVADRNKELVKVIRDAGYEVATIPAGKLRRYFSWRHFVDPFLVCAGFFRSIRILQKQSPDVVFSKGGFVALPMVVASWLMRTPVVVHESDATAGWANRISARLAKRVATGFGDVSARDEKFVFTGNPVRPTITTGSVSRARRHFRLSTTHPTLLVLGGSQGSQAINEAVRDALPRLLRELQVIHVVGPAKLTDIGATPIGYHPVGYLHDSLRDAYAVADIVVSRAGASVLAELAATGTPAVVIPLPTSANNHQAQNAERFAEVGAAEVLRQNSLSGRELSRVVLKLLHDPQRRSSLSRAIKRLATPDAASRLSTVIEEAAHV